MSGDIKYRPIKYTVDADDWLLVQPQRSGTNEEYRVRADALGGAGGGKARKTVALLGDSYIVRDTQNNNGSGFQQVSIKSIFEWTNIRLGKRLKPIYYDGVNGSTIGDFIPRLPAAIAASADYVYIQGTVNNFGTQNLSYATQVGLFTTAINAVVAAGQTPIVTTIPCNANVSTTQKYLDWIAINNWLRTTGKELGAIICDYANDIINPNSLTGQPVASFTDTSDGIHRTSAGAIIASYYAANSLKESIPEWQIPWTEIYDASSTGITGLIKNPIMAGSGGTAGTGASGVIAATWSVSTFAGSTAVGSIITRTDNAAGNWQQIVYTPGSSENNTCDFSSGNLTGLGGKSVGDSIELFMEFEIDAANIGMLKGIAFRYHFVGATTERSYEFVDYQTNALDIKGGTLSGVLSTPIRTIPVGATGISILFQAVQKATGSPVTFRIGRVTIV